MWQLKYLQLILFLTTVILTIINNCHCLYICTCRKIIQTLGTPSSGASLFAERVNSPASTLSNSCPSTPSTPDFSQGATASTSSKSDQEFQIPRKWKPAIMIAIREKSLDGEVRCEITRDLVTHMYSYTERPTLKFAEEPSSLSLSTRLCLMLIHLDLHM